MKIYTPVLNGMNSVRSSVKNFFGDYFFAVKAGQENRDLKNVIASLSIENASLKTALGFKESFAAASETYRYLNKRLVPVHLIAFDPFLSSRTVVIDAGLSRGIALNDVVVAGKGLVGRVVEVFDNSSKVLLLIDPYFSVDVKNQRTGLRALVSGLSTGDLKASTLPFLSQIVYFEKSKDMTVGDILETSGLGQVYPPGLHVGEIVELDTPEKLVDGFIVRPSVDFTKLDTLFVLVQ